MANISQPLVVRMTDLYKPSGLIYLSDSYWHTLNLIAEAIIFICNLICFIFHFSYFVTPRISGPKMEHGIWKIRDGKCINAQN